MKLRLFALALGSAVAAALPATAVQLSNGPGDGSVSVGVDAFGSFGSSIDGDGASDAIFDPVGSIAAAGTTFESAVAVSSGGARTYLTSGFLSGSSATAANAAFQSQSATSATSSFSVGFLDFQLQQTLTEAFDADGMRTGSLLNQVYTIRNSADVANSFDVVRYIDGDLLFDGTLNDGGGRIFRSGSEILFETDSASGDDESTTFLGITANGGQIPTENRFELSSFSGLRSQIANGGPLDDAIQNDTDSDGFIDSPYDVTLALRNVFNLAAGETAQYTTQTLFGNAVPPAPGSSEALPLLPSDIDPDGAFQFTLDADDITPGQTIFIDPDIAVGYTYSVVGAEFESVTAPTFAAVGDPDGYMVLFTIGATDFTEFLAAGDTLDFLAFGGPVTTFTLLGIDPALLLDPTDTMAFVTGIALTNVLSGTTVTITQAPIVETTDAPVPLPASALLMAPVFGVIGSLGWRRRRRARAA